MARYGFIFKIKPEFKDEFQKAHAEIWPELKKEIKNVGINNYTHFYRTDGLIFAYFESDDPEKSLSELVKKEIRTKWEINMEKYFVKEDRSQLGPESIKLEETFHLD
jgi:L-rhamnose mutarotase